MSFCVVILAAGQGTRMHSNCPKVLHQLAGKPLLQHIVETALQLEPQAIYVVYGHGGEQVPTQLSHLAVVWICQQQQLGTGHALATALPVLDPVDQVLVLNADVPLIQAHSLLQLLEASASSVLAVMTAKFINPQGLGRIVRDDVGKIKTIVEERDANDVQRAICEINTGTFVFKQTFLQEMIGRISDENAQAEFYITDLVKIASNDNLPLASYCLEDAREAQGVNNRVQLAQLERYYQIQQAEQLMLAGVTLADPARFDLRGQLTHGKDVFIDVNVILQGEVVFGNEVVIDANVTIINSKIGDRVHIKANSIVDNAQIADDCEVGPFARIRPDTQLDSFCKIGNFVETKKATIGRYSKVNHLSYIGDAKIGQAVNVGAGTITCNYDGINKFETIIGDEAFIGSGTQLVAPVVIGEKATIAAGSTVRKSAPSKALTLTQKIQKSYTNWLRPTDRKQSIDK